MAKNFLDWVQKQSHETRLKIMWGTVAIAAIIVVAVWIFSIKSNLSNISGASLTQIASTDGSEAAETTVPFASVERAESTAAGLKLYLDFNNPTSDILNIPASSEYELVANSKTSAPTEITDRQGGDFVQKILSHNQNFAILVFPAVKADNAELTVSGMFLEQSPTQLLKQTIKLDLKNLEGISNPRN